MIKPGTPADWRGPVYVVNQVDPTTRRFDEHKAILGAESPADAEAVYRSNYAPGWNGLGSLEAMPFEVFKQWASDPKQTQRRAETAPETAKSTAELVKDNMGLAVTIANSYRNIPGFEDAETRFQDILGEARKALVKAARSFDPAHDSGRPFGSYAGTAIRNALNDLFSKQRQIMEREGRSADEPIGDGREQMADGRGEGDSLKDLHADRARRRRCRAGSRGGRPGRRSSRPWKDCPSACARCCTWQAKGKSLREIGEAIGLSHEMARRILENGKKAVKVRLDEKGFKGVDADGMLYAAPVAEHEMAAREIGEEADRIEQGKEPQTDERPQEFLKEITTRAFAGRLDALDHVVPGAKRLLTDAHIKNAKISAALRIFREKIQENVRKSFGYPSWWRETANRKRMERFTAELLPDGRAVECDGTR
jgi:DNA-directed RNA polymerase specialized sigma subunit